MSKIVKTTFVNADGVELSAKIEFPVDRSPKGYALFAHCFTCGKNLKAIQNIAHCLTKRGIAVLRFDFTGLGESEGDFADTNFSSNTSDIVAAAKYLTDNYEAPTLLIGHSLGGTAVLSAAFNLPSVEAIATLGSPAEAAHVQHLITSKKEEIEKTGCAVVNIGGRPFKIKRQFLEDLQQHSLKRRLQRLSPALLILHSPQDQIVSISNATTLYKAARHPKSFISLDQADHLLSNADDAYYAGETIASWASRYFPVEASTALASAAQVAARLHQQDLYTSDIKAGRHHFVADEPESFGGNDFGPSPYELLASSLAACTVMTLQMYARRKKWDLQEVTVHINHRKEKIAANGQQKSVDVFDKEIALIGKLDDTQKNRLLEIADRCPVHRTLHSDVIINSKLEKSLHEVQ